LSVAASGRNRQSDLSGENLKGEGGMGTGVPGGSRKRRQGNFPQTVGQPGRLGDWVQYGNCLILFNLTPSVLWKIKQNKTSVSFW